MSYNNIPSDQTVAGLAKYCWLVYHSGGQYDRVPKREKEEE